MSQKKMEKSSPQKLLSTSSEKSISTKHQKNRPLCGGYCQAPTVSLGKERLLLFGEKTMAKLTQTLQQLCLILVHGYINYLSPHMRKRCVFYPSCSVYASTALKEKTFFTACMLILNRLFRCHPWSKGGFDPI